jgi:hypothetical protein
VQEATFMKKTLSVALLATLIVAHAAVIATAQPAVAPPAAPATIWSFMGIPQGLNKVNGALFNRRGNLPCLEKKPALKGLADPANLFSENPAIKRAAQIKQEENLKPQKIKAIKYLAKIGCGCYDKDGSITKAMISAMDDCTEEVRLAAIEAVNTALRGEECENCSQRSCCNEEIVKKLASIVYDRDEHGCYKEPSERVRAAAEEAMYACCTGRGPLIIEEPSAEPQPAEPRPDATDDAPPAPPAEARQPDETDARFVSSRRTAHRQLGPRPPAADVATADAPAPAIARPAQGLTILVDLAKQEARLVLPESCDVVPVGTRLEVYDARNREQPIGQLEVRALQQGTLIAKPANGLDLSLIGPGTIVRRVR